MAETQYVLTQTKQGLKEWIPLPTGGVAPHNQAWSTITDTPTTLAGYGITDGGGSMEWPGAGIPLSTGSAWGTSYSSSGSGTVIPLQTSPTLLGTISIGDASASDIGITFKGNIANAQSILWEAEDASDRFKLYANLDAVLDNDLLVFRSLTVDNVLKLKGSGNVLIGSPSSGVALSLGRYSGQPNIKSSDIYMIMDSNTGFAAVNYYVTDNVLLAGGGGNVGVGYQSASVPLGKLCINGGVHVGGLSDPGDNNLWIDGIAQEPNFISGWQGTNWQIQSDGDAEFNNVRIRGGLSVYELIINQLHYQNGGLIIGAGAGKIATIITSTAGSEVLTFHDPEGNDMVPFTAGAIVMCQRVDISKTVANGYTGDVVKKIVRQVASVSGMEVTLTTTSGWLVGDDTGIFEVGDEICAIGHTSNTSIDSSIYISATDADNPFLRVFDGVNTYGKFSLGDKSTIKLQLGNLASLASYDILPANPGYGLYTNNAYLSGTAKIGMSANGSGYGIVIENTSIYEGLYNGDNSTLYINQASHLGSYDHYRNTEICDGKGNMIVRFIGGATNKALFDGTVECDGILQADGATTFNNYVTFNSLPATHNVYFRLAQYTTAQRDLLAGVGGSTWEGTLIVNTTTHKLNFWNGSAWKEVSSS